MKSNANASRHTAAVASSIPSSATMNARSLRSARTCAVSQPPREPAAARGYAVHTTAAAIGDVAMPSTRARIR